MAAKGGVASKLMTVALLLAVLAGAGAWNYHRNLQAEAQEEEALRPLAGYDDAGLLALAEAYQAEIAELEALEKRAREAHQAPGAKTAFVGENLKEFERVQRSSQGIRDLMARISEHQARLAEIQEEQAHRARSGAGGLDVHLRRLTSI